MLVLGLVPLTELLIVYQNSINVFVLLDSRFCSDVLRLRAGQTPSMARIHLPENLLFLYCLQEKSWSSHKAPAQIMCPGREAMGEPVLGLLFLAKKACTPLLACAVNAAEKVSIAG